MRARLPLAAIAAAIVSYSLLLQANPDSSATPDALERDTGDQPMSIRTMRIGSLGGVPATPVGGTVVPSREVTFTAQFAGRVDYVAGQEGDAFEAGTILVGMDEEALNAQRYAAEAEVARAEAMLSNSRVQYQRELKSPNGGGKGGMPFMTMVPFMGDMRSNVDRSADIHQARTGIEQAQARLFEAESRIQGIDAKYADARGTAPFNGVIIEKLVNAGETVNPGQPLIRFGDISRPQIQADVPARLVNTLHVGKQITAKLDNTQGSVVNIRVAQIFPKADPVRHTIRVKFDIAIGSQAAAGMYAKVLIPGPQDASQTRNDPVIPNSAIVYRAGLPMAWVLGRSGRREMRLLRLGDSIDQNRVMVLTGLSVGETLVLDPPHH